MDGDSVLWAKVVHLLAVFSWMAGMFYLPRLLVYHTECLVGSEASELFKIMERRLLKAIMRPAMIVSVGSGIGVGLLGRWFEASWSWVWFKVVLVCLLVIVHLVLERHVKLLALDQRGYSGRYFRVLNEIPTLLLIGIVILVVLKPF